MSDIHSAAVRFSEKQMAEDPILRYFHYSHHSYLPKELQEIAKPFCAMAKFIIINIPRNPERTVALRKLLEAKEAAVRANVR